MVRATFWAGVMLAIVIVSSAQAQRRGFNLPPVVQNLFLMRAEPVQKELGLSEEQAKSIAELASQMQSEAMEIMSGLQDLTPE